jgi:hypothetical protein
MKTRRFNSGILLVTLSLSVATQSQAQQPALRSNKTYSSDADSRINSSTLLARMWRSRRTGLSLMPSGSDASVTAVTAASSNSAVHGSGTVGKISIWADVRPNGDATLGDSIITQFNDNIGIGLNKPTSKLTVQGMIETTLGGYKFPDGTIQTTAAVSGIQTVIHDATLEGDGTSISPLKVAVPLNLFGAGGTPGGSTLYVENTGSGPSSLGIGVHARGAFSDTSFGGEGVRAVGGPSSVKSGGFGLFAIGGFGVTVGSGGHGVFTFGGRGIGGGDGVNAHGGEGSEGQGGNGVSAVAGAGIHGGEGVSAVGGNSLGGIGGNGVNALGGDITDLASGGFGGHGVVATGGTGFGSGRKGGLGLLATGGSGELGAAHGDAAHFVGNVDVSGNLSKGGGSFKIDHPLDPENKYLYHSFVESPDMKNIYDGTVTTDANGDAVVELPAYFEALNKQFRYQLTVIGTFAQAIVADEIKGNRFMIKTNAANVKVSWQVTGVRQDAYANKNRIKSEEEKPERERGFYLHPEVFDQPEERGVEWARNPEMMRQMKETRLKTIEDLKQKAQSKDR